MQKAFRYEPDDNNESGKGELRGARMYDMFDTMMGRHQLSSTPKRMKVNYGTKTSCSVQYTQMDGPLAR